MARRPDPLARSASVEGSPEPIAALNRIRILEYALPWIDREPLVDIRTFCPNVLFAERLCPFLRQSTAEMLNRAHASLPANRRFRIGTALRTLSMQKGGWDRYFKRMQDEHPSWPLSSLRRATNKYFAPYDQKAPPGHCTGGAVDVTLVDADNQPVDVTSPTEGWEAAYTWSDKLTPEARANRMVMVEAMLGAGFSNCRDEYWHYSWGDSAWAVRVGEYECPYGWTYPPVCLETDFPQASATDIAIETVRDVSGRPLAADGSCSLRIDAARTPENWPVWCVGLYWARDVAVTLRLSWPNSPEDARLFGGSALDKLTPLTDVFHLGDTLLIRITPSTDHVFLSNFPSATPEQPVNDEGVTGDSKGS